MRIASICAVSALALGFIHSPALAQNPPPTPLPTISEREEVRTTYIFKFDDSVDRGEMHARAQQAVAGTGGTLRHVYTEVLGGFAATLPSTALWNVARRPGIVSFERDQIFTIASSHKNCDGPNPHPSCGKGGGGDDSDGGEGGGGGGGGGDDVALDCPGGGEMPWGVGYVRKNAMPKTGACGEGIHVYVLDTGIDLDHENLVPVGKSVDCTKGCGTGGDDKNGHGTHVAGTIGARGKTILGVAPAVHLHGVQVLKPGGTGSMSDIIAGINYVAGEAKTVVDTEGNVRGPVVANMSLGGSGSKGSGKCHAVQQGTDSDNNPIYFVGTSSLHEAMCDAAHAGVVFAVAAGNSGADAKNFIPAAYDDVAITVSATNRSNDWPSWSNWGNDSALWAPTNSVPVAVAAPGVSIVSTKKDGGTTPMSGTSMASPHVAGVAALLLQEKIIADAGYSSTYEAFVNIRKGILNRATDTVDSNGNPKSPFENTSGKPHKESFACAVQGCP